MEQTFDRQGCSQREPSSNCFWPHHLQQYVNEFSSLCLLFPVGHWPLSKIDGCNRRTVNSIYSVLILLISFIFQCLNLGRISASQCRGREIFFEQQGPSKIVFLVFNLLKYGTGIFLLDPKERPLQILSVWPSWSFFFIFI